MEEHRRDLQEDHPGCEWRLAVGMLQVGEEESSRLYSGGVELVGIALYVVFPSPVSQYVRARAPVVPVELVLLVMHVACVAPPYHARDRDRSPPAGREVENSWQTVIPIVVLNWQDLRRIV